ncbi:MAG: phage tail protein [Beijerinckiaceae bacterium]
MGLFGIGSHAVYPQYAGLQIQTSSGAVPISIVWGASKIAPNVVWAGNFQVIARNSKTGGKGAVGSILGGPTTSYDYRSALVLGLCEGPIQSVQCVWNGQTLTSLTAPQSAGKKGTTGLGLTLFTGTTPQSTWGYLTSAFPAQALPYGGLAYVCNSNFDLGSSATLPSLWFETYGVLAATGANGVDADPAAVIQDFLTNPQYGVGFPPASIDASTLFGSGGDASYQTYCFAAGLAISPALTDQEAANSILARWLQITNTAAVWSSGVLKFIPYGDSEITGNLISFSGPAYSFYVAANTNISSAHLNPSTLTGTRTFVPNLTPVYNLSDDDFIYDDGKDPVLVQRSDPYASYNMQILEIYQRSNYYDATPIVAFDQNAIELYGLRIASTVTAHEICDENVAQTSAQLILQRGLYIRNHYTFKLSWEYCLLEPMDLVTLSDANLGLNNTVVRVTEVEEDDNSLLTFTAEEFPGGIATSVLYPVQTGSSSNFDRGGAPGSVNTPLIFEPPPSLAGATPQVWMGASGGPAWGGCVVWVSLDDTSYVAIGSITSAARQGVLTAALAAYAGINPDSTDTLAVSMAESSAALTGTTAAGAQNAATLSIVNGELLAYETATLTGASAYALTTLERGLYGSAAMAHAIGAPFTRLDSSIFEYDLPTNYIGKELYLKFQSFNIFGGAAQDLSTCTAYTYTPIGTGSQDPIAAQLASGLPVDLGFVNLTPLLLDDFGTVGPGAVLGALDLGAA